MKQIDILNMSNEQVEGLVNKMKDIIDPVQKLSFLISDNEQLCNLLWDIHAGLISERSLLNIGLKPDYDMLEK